MCNDGYDIEEFKDIGVWATSVIYNASKASKNQIGYMVYLFVGDLQIESFCVIIKCICLKLKYKMYFGMLITNILYVLIAMN